MEAYPAHAKINLFLRVLRRREDGRHEIETLFQRLGLADRLHFEKTEEEGIHLECRGLPVDCGAGADNLVVRAYNALLGRCGERAGRPASGGVRVILEKRIPAGSGLGGGSSDAGTTLTVLNELFGLGFEPESLREIARGLGADVPFFLGAPAAIGRGVGGDLEPLAHSARFWAVVALPDFGVSTAEVYSRWAPAAREGEAGNLSSAVDALQRADLGDLLHGMWNDLEPPAFSVVPRLGRLREDLESRARQPVRMSGSGSALFTLTDSDDEARAIAGLWEEIPSLQVCATPFV